MPGTSSLLSGLTSVDRMQSVGGGGFPALPPDRDTDRGPPASAVLLPLLSPQIKSGVTAGGGDGLAHGREACPEILTGQQWNKSGHDDWEGQSSVSVAGQ